MDGRLASCGSSDASWVRGVELEWRGRHLRACLCCAMGHQDAGSVVSCARCVPRSLKATGTRLGYGLRESRLVDAVVLMVSSGTRPASILPLHPEYLVGFLKVVFAV
jgi:hypothetical protein